PKKPVIAANTRARKTHLREPGEARAALPADLTRYARLQYTHHLGEKVRDPHRSYAWRAVVQDAQASQNYEKISRISESDAKYARGSGRLELAEAIIRQPLAARVIANRIWGRHFGRGIVPTSSNFGASGEPPTHPELLDYLAARLVANGWSMKTLHREIMLSA